MTSELILVSTRAVKEKLWNLHQVSFMEVEEAFFNHTGKMIEDDREKNRTNPPTLWFIGETMMGRPLKVVVIPRLEVGELVVRTAYEPDEFEVKFYESKQSRKRT